jgi:transposase
LRRWSHEQEIESFFTRNARTRCIHGAGTLGRVPIPLVQWFKKAEVDSGVCEGVTSSEREQLKALERENRELRRANEILKLASAFFAQAELDRRLKS